MEGGGAGAMRTNLKKKERKKKESDMDRMKLYKIKCFKVLIKIATGICRAIKCPHKTPYAPGL